MADVKPAQLLTVERQAIRVVIVVRRKEFVPVALLGRDLGLQRRVIEDFVADEVDARHAGCRALGYGEDQIDAVLRTLNDLRIDRCRELAVTPIEFDDALYVRLHLGARENRSRLQLDFLLEVLLRDLALAFELYLIDDRIFDDAHRQRGAIEFHANVGEQTGLIEGLQCKVGCLLVVDVAFSDRDVGKNRRRLDTLRSENDDVLDDLCAGRGDWRNRRDRGSRNRARFRSGSGIHNRQKHNGGKSRARYSGEQGDVAHPVVSGTRCWAQLPHCGASPTFQKRFSRTRSFQVARMKIPSTTASPSLNPTSWARSPSGRPKTPSHA